MAELKLYKKLGSSIVKDFMYNSFTEFCVPTECNLEVDGFYTPKRGRIYYTQFHYYGGEVLTPKEIWKRKAEDNTTDNRYNYGPDICMVEYWHDEGDDGHTYYRLQGHYLGIIMKRPSWNERFSWEYVKNELYTEPDIHNGDSYFYNEFKGNPSDNER